MGDRHLECPVCRQLPCDRHRSIDLAVLAISLLLGRFAQLVLPQAIRLLSVDVWKDKLENVLVPIDRFALDSLLDVLSRANVLAWHEVVISYGMCLPQAAPTNPRGCQPGKLPIETRQDVAGSAGGRVYRESEPAEISEMQLRVTTSHRPHVTRY
nr:hypothetical protein CFP56_11247 [Quercus suber]